MFSKVFPVDDDSCFSDCRTPTNRITLALAFRPWSWGPIQLAGRMKRSLLHGGSRRRRLDLCIHIYIYIFVIPKMSHGVLLAFKLLGRAFFVSCLLLLLLRLRPDVF